MHVARTFCDYKMKRVLNRDSITGTDEVLQRKKRKTSRKDNPNEDVSEAYFDDGRDEEIIIKEEFLNSYSDGEEIFSNDVNFKLEIETFKKETENIDGLLMREKVGSNKRNLSVESVDDTDFEEAFQHCTNSHEKSQLVERKKIENKTGELTFEEISILKQLKIEIPWPLPICHSIETRVSSYPTKQQKEKFAALEIKFATGPYSNDETSKIKENWSEFCKSHNIEENPKLFLNFIWDGKVSYLRKQERINFVRYLAKGMEHRPLWSIYERFQRLYSEIQKGNFTSKEDDIIMSFYENSSFSNKNSALALVLNRTRASIRNRYNILKAEDSKIKFTMEMDQIFLDNLMAVTGKTCIAELRDVEFDINHYKEISSKMNISCMKLKRRWELVLKVRLFIEDYTFLQDIREKLINLLSKGKFTDRREINWKQLATHFDNITSSKLYKIFMDLLCSYVPEPSQKSLTNIIMCLKHAQNHMVNKKLKKYEYAGKNLIF